MDFSEKTFFHIGLPRTGTTSLQVNLFTQEQYFVPISEEPDKNKKFWRFAGIGNPIPQSLCETDAARKEVQRLQEEAVRTSRRLMISDEGVTSLGSTLANQELTVGRMREVSTNPEIILVLRRQQDMIRSRYTQHKMWKHWAALGLSAAANSLILGSESGTGRRDLYRLTSARVVRFDRWLIHGARTQHSNWFSNFNYFYLYKVYADALGKEHVHVLFYEDLVTTPEEYMATLSGILGLDHSVVSNALRDKRNVSAGNLRRRVLRSPKNGGVGILNFLRLNWHQVTKRGGVNPAITSELKEVVKRSWGSQNSRLADELKVDLLEKGYLM